jgi:hypothetical protein
MSFDADPKDKEESFSCKCGGNIIKASGVWECDKCGWRKIENSSNLIGYFYDYVTRCLFIEFKGGTVYRYDAVSETVYNAFAESPSKGTFLANSIKPHFTATKMPVEKIENSPCV